MTEENKWKEVSKDISDLSNKIKDNFVDEDNIKDLKETLNSAKISIKNNFSNLITAIEDTVKDEEIKEEALSVVIKMKDEFSKSFDTIKNKIPNNYNMDFEKVNLLRKNNFQNNIASGVLFNEILGR